MTIGKAPVKAIGWYHSGNIWVVGGSENANGRYLYYGRRKYHSLAMAMRHMQELSDYYQAPIVETNPQ